jgi:hypothetical protein
MTLGTQCSAKDLPNPTAEHPFSTNVIEEHNIREEAEIIKCQYDHRHNKISQREPPQKDPWLMQS